MVTAVKALHGLTASDLMTRNVLTLHEGMPLRDALRLLVENQISGAPVVDTQGKCVGVLSAIDLVRLAEKHGDVTRLPSSPLPLPCPFQVKLRIADGEETLLCILPPGVCPMQVEGQAPADGNEILLCGQPHRVLTERQIVELEKLLAGEVRRYMTADPVIVPPGTPIRVLARLMINAHIHRLIVADEQRTPIGIVSSTDILAAVAYDESEE